VFSFDKYWKPFIVMNNEYWTKEINTNDVIRKYNKNRIKDIKYWIWNFPVLLRNWVNFTRYYNNVIDNKMKLRTAKNFICSTKDWKTIFMWYVYNISMLDLANYIKNNFNCYNAINLDAWWSLWMIYKNKVIHKEWRKIMDAFVVIEWKENIKKYYENLNEQIKKEKIKQYW